jgi:hypothetical protein
MNIEIPRRDIDSIPEVIAFRLPRRIDELRSWRCITKKEDGKPLRYLICKLDFPGGYLLVYVHGLSECKGMEGKTVHGKATVREKVQNGATILYVDLHVTEDRTDAPVYRMTTMDGTMEQWAREGWYVYSVPQKLPAGRLSGACLIFAPVDGAKILPNEVPSMPAFPRRAVRTRERTACSATVLKPPTAVTSTKNGQKEPTVGSLADQLARLFDQIQTRTV